MTFLRSSGLMDPEPSASKRLKADKTASFHNGKGGGGGWVGLGRVTLVGDMVGLGKMVGLVLGRWLGLGWSLSGWLGRWLGWVWGVAFKQSKSAPMVFFAKVFLGISTMTSLMTNSKKKLTTPKACRICFLTSMVAAKKSE